MSDLSGAQGSLSAYLKLDRDAGTVQLRILSHYDHPSAKHNSRRNLWSSLMSVAVSTSPLRRGIIAYKSKTLSSLGEYNVGFTTNFR